MARKALNSYEINGMGYSPGKLCYVSHVSRYRARPIDLCYVIKK